MQYLMIDLHQRFIGALTQDSPLSVGDILRVGSSQNYRVVRVDKARNPAQKSVTVIPLASITS